MKFYQILIILLLLVSCKNKIEPNNKKSNSLKKGTSFFVGTYTDTKSKGIYSYSLSDSGKIKKIKLATKTENPSFITKSYDGNYLLAVNEVNSVNGMGTVESYKILGDSLQFISRQSSGGAHPCYVTTNRQGYVLAANYTGGNIGLLKLNNKGVLSNLLDVKQHTGKGTNERQEAPHAHSAWFVPDSDETIAADLGTNELWFSRLDTTVQKLQTINQQKLQMDANAGPRHLTIHPNGKWIYVLNELNSTITLVEKNSDGNYIKKNSVSILPNDYTGSNSGADIHISWSGKFVYASNRGHNSIAILKTNSLDGSLTLIGNETKNIDTPRNFSLSPDEKFLLVANQNSNSIVSFKRDTKTGLLEFVHEVEAPTPVCILF